MSTRASNGARIDITQTQELDWSAILAQNGRWLRTIVLARTGDPSAMEEVMQNVAVAAISSATGPSDSTKLLPWLYRVAVKQALMYRRKLGRLRRFHRDYTHRAGSGENGGRCVDPLAWLIRDEQRTLIRTALCRIPPRHAEALLLKYVHAWTYKEMAGHLGISQCAIVSRVNRARSQFRAQLARLNAHEVT